MTQSDDISDRLSQLIREKLGPEAAVSQLSPLPGHAGMGFSFEVRRTGAAAKQKLVIRTVPEGVPPTGPADVVRQAEIMRAVAAAGLPTPRMIWFENDSAVFGRPYFIAEFVDGRGLPQDWRDQTDHDRRLARQGVKVMAKLHQLDSRALESAFGPPRPVADEFERLQKLWDRPTIDPAHAGQAALLRDRLLASAPENLRIGCVHGDMHFGNMIFGEDDVLSVVDWEIALIGPTLLDLGLIAFYADPDAWLPEHRDRALRWVLPADEMIETYRAAIGQVISDRDIDWHRAFGGYRFGAITLFNEMLHRRGKRHDPMWPDLIRSAPAMMERGLELLARSG